MSRGPESLDLPLGSRSRLSGRTCHCYINRSHGEETLEVRKHAEVQPCSREERTGDRRGVAHGRGRRKGVVRCNDKSRRIVAGIV